MPLQIIRNDITKVKVDAIVNTANPEPVVGSGTDRAIYDAAGASLLLVERKKIGRIAVGEANITPAFNLDAKIIIHTVGPVWKDGNYRERENLAACYRNALRCAVKNRCKSIAFPLISSGAYAFPKDEALKIAISEISDFLLDTEMQVFLVVFDKKAFQLSGQLFRDVDSYIDENYVEKQKFREYRFRRGDAAEYNECGTAFLEDMSLPMGTSRDSRSLEDVIGQVGETFQQRLLRLIDERQKDDVEVYKKANMDRKLFSKIRCNKRYKPKKQTALALAVALELNLDETKDLLSRAGYALSPSSRFDLIVEYFIDRGVYDIYTINLALFQHDEDTLG